MAKEIGIMYTFFGLLDSKYYVHMLIFWWKLNCMLCLSLWNYWSNAPTYCCLEKKGEPKASEAWIEKIPFHGNVQWSLEKKEFNRKHSRISSIRSKKCTFWTIAFEQTLWAMIGCLLVVQFFADSLLTVNAFSWQKKIKRERETSLFCR